MEPETQQYDGDAEAWDRWQVRVPVPPTAPPPVPVFASGGLPGLSTVVATPTNVTQQSNDEVPTVPYVEPAAFDATIICKEPDAHSAPSMFDAPTLACDTSPPKDLPHSGALSSACNPQANNESLVCGPTLAYGEGTQRLDSIPGQNQLETHGELHICDPTLSYSVDTQRLDAPVVSYLPPSAPLNVTTWPSMPEPETQAWQPQEVKPTTNRPIAHEPETQDWQPQEVRPSVNGPIAHEPETQVWQPQEDRPFTTRHTVAEPETQVWEPQEAQPVATTSPGVMVPVSAVPAAELGTTVSVAPMMQHIQPNSASTMPESVAPASMAPPRGAVRVVPVAKDVLATSVKKRAAPVPRRLRLNGKQSLHGVNAVAVAATAPAAAPAAKKARKTTTGRTRCIPQPHPSNHTSSPVLGNKVRVQGDGWGGGHGEYMATVTEADDFTFTVIIHNQWEETHVLRAHCTLLDQ